MARYTPNYRGIGEYLKYSPELKRELYRRALLGQSTAASLMHHKTGKMAASGRVVDNGPNGGFRHNRMELAVVFTVPYAVPATWHNARQVALDALLAAVSVMERG